jgi:hypothetical protein
MTFPVNREEIAVQGKRPATMSRGCLVIGLAAVSAAFSGACGSSAITPSDGRTGDTVADAGRDNALPETGTPEISPPTPVGAGSTVVIPGNARLIGRGADSCTHQVPATTDRWCAVARPSSFLGNTDLWVVNVTQALAGQPIKCTGSGTNCFRLTTALFDGDLTMHGFSGDTLIYYAENNSSQSFVGTVFAWRPEWPEPKALTSQTGLFCQAHPTALAAMCIQNPAGDDTQTLLDLTAGNLNVAGQLPLVDTFLYSVVGDPDGVTKSNFELSPDGQSVLWSSRATAKGPEILRMQTLNNAASKHVVANDVAQWTVAPDSKNWYWLSGFNYSTTGMTSGTLQLAPYPAGTPPVTLATGVGDFTIAGSKGLVYRSGVRMGLGALKVISDVADPDGTTKQLDTTVLRIWTLSQDGTAAMYSKSADAAGQLVDMFLHSTDKTAACALASTPVALGFGDLTSTSRNAAWVRVTDQNNTGAFYTAFDTCTSRKFATNILSLDPIADQGYVYLDEGDEMGTTGTLRYNQLMNGQLSLTGQIVQREAQPTAAVLWPAHPAVVYTIASQGSTDGLYVNATLPFVNLLPPPPRSDAGAPEASVDVSVDVTPASDDGAVTAGEAGETDSGATPG